MKTLYLEKRGCNFWGDETVESDIGNYRVCTHGEDIHGKDGNMYFLEFSLWRDRKKARTKHKVTGKPLKKVHYDIINSQGLAIDTQYTDYNGMSWRNVSLERELNKDNYSYNTADILKVVNRISTEQYDNIVIK